MYQIDHTKTTMENMVGLANEKYTTTANDKLLDGDFIAGVPATVTPGAGNGNSNTSLVLTGAPAGGHFGQTTIYYDRFKIADSRPSAGSLFLGESNATHAQNHAKILERLRLVGEEVIFTDPSYSQYPGGELIYTLNAKADSLVYLPGEFNVTVRGMGVPDETQLPVMNTNTWLQLAPGTTPAARVGHASAVVNGKLYIHGGYTVISNLPVGDLWRYDPVANTWQQLPTGPTMGFHSTAVVKGVIYTYGGCRQPGSSSTSGLTELWKYDPATNQWTQLANGPIAAFLLRATVIGDVIYFAGGYSGAMVANSCRTYNTTTNTWGTFTYDIALYGHILVNHGGTLYRYFGRDTTTTLSSRVDKLLTPAGSWESVPFTSPPPQSYGSAFTTYGGKTYVHGGDNIVSTLYDHLYSHDPVSNTWEQLAEAPTGRRNHTLNEINGRLYLFGGTTNWANTTLSGELWVYKP